MLEPDKITKIATDAATTNLASAAVTRVISETATDSQGRDALKITIVIRPDALGRLTGDAALDTLVQIQEQLAQAGEERFPIVEYATEKELQESGD